ncbi:type II toxin-antitoxin system HicB family antitoxin [Salmonella enterica subsp. enterica]|nr:type II toxin-antitoxin system HicB family antitoxin [Salmonella enterica]ECG6803867.1 type II toxin-antitoxin system HicB family antitoxin [Salmonella enterica subsp. enterica serovar Muenchen]EDW0701317.1 type II toxin-antitoxin system HicB family antitoxin [Salmonella enterica subsp. enterica]EEP4262187.1 type II toxin-antitoxin system HicB family antitoxin [Salmonella enterica subsp. enterica serovar Oranienburg]HBM0000739.1 type II toxin-antitoxin system HicB family antitoxin [Salmonell
MMKYTIQITRDTTGFMAVCRDMPKFVTAGETKEEIITLAPEAFEIAVECYMDENIPVPLPSGDTPEKGCAIVLPVTLSAKIELYNALLASHVSKSELARRMGIPNQNIKKLLSPSTKSRLDTIESAFAALGKRLDISVSAA